MYKITNRDCRARLRSLSAGANHDLGQGRGKGLGRSFDT